MRIHLEYITVEGEPENLDYVTLKTEIINVSAERGPNFGEQIGKKYVDLTLDESGWDASEAIQGISHNEQRMKHKMFNHNYSLSLEQFRTLVGNLCIKSPGELKGVEVTALYHAQSQNSFPTLIGFIRPQDKVELKK